jgi:hypothetical protein
MICRQYNGRQHSKRAGAEAFPKKNISNCPSRLKAVEVTTTIAYQVQQQEGPRSHLEALVPLRPQVVPGQAKEPVQGQEPVPLQVQAQEPVPLQVQAQVPVPLQVQAQEPRPLRLLALVLDRSRLTLGECRGPHHTLSRWERLARAPPRPPDRQLRENRGEGSYEKAENPNMHVKKATSVCLITSISVGESGPVLYLTVHAACFRGEEWLRKTRGAEFDKKARKPEHAKSCKLAGNLVLSITCSSISPSDPVL